MSKSLAKDNPSTLQTLCLAGFFKIFPLNRPLPPGSSLKDIKGSYIKTNIRVELSQMPAGIVHYF